VENNSGPLRKAGLPTARADALEDPRETRLQALWVDSRFTAQRFSFHASAGLRYLWELPRWLNLTRSIPQENIPDAHSFYGLAMFEDRMLSGVNYYFPLANI
jgi:hypothetical protein